MLASLDESTTMIEEESLPGACLDPRDPLTRCRIAETPRGVLKGHGGSSSPRN